MTNNQPQQHPLFNFGATAQALRVVRDQSQAFADNPAALTTDGALLQQEIRNPRREMNTCFDRIEQRAIAE
jgi:hypothetical protein